MRDLLALCTPDDYAFLVGLIESPLNATQDDRLERLLTVYRAEQTEEMRAVLDDALVEAVGYLGSGEAAYWLRKASGKPPGVSFQEVARDVARKLKLDVRLVGTDREVAETIAELYATETFSGLEAQEQQRLLEELGVERDRAVAFLKSSAGVFALPLVLQTFDAIVVRGLVQGVIVRAITRMVGTTVARRLLGFAVSGMPWWLKWIKPAAWTLSLGYAGYKVQGPADRKIVPLVLYLGLVALRTSYAEEEAA
jgi:uncharacterized protein YaaW (UPF0174 family)